jgi:hypothetical protein
MTRSFKYVCLGGGNSAGYLAKELVAAGLQPGELCIITDEPVSGAGAFVKRQHDIADNLSRIAAGLCERGKSS